MGGREKPGKMRETKKKGSKRDQRCEKQIRRVGQVKVTALDKEKQSIQ